jgi:hypothetical protein
MKAITRFLFEHSILEPSWTALLCGFAVIGLDGRLYITEAGAEYLEDCHVST